MFKRIFGVPAARVALVLCGLAAFGLSSLQLGRDEIQPAMSDNTVTIGCIWRAAPITLSVDKTTAGINCDSNGDMQVAVVGAVSATVAFPLPGGSSTPVGPNQSVGVQATDGGGNLAPVGEIAGAMQTSTVLTGGSANIGNVGLTAGTVVQVGGTNSADNLSTIGACTNVALSNGTGKLASVSTISLAQQTLSTDFTVYDEGTSPTCTSADKIYDAAGMGSEHVIASGHPFKHGLTWQITVLGPGAPTSPSGAAGGSGSCAASAYKYVVAGLNGPGGSAAQEGLPSSEFTVAAGSGSQQNQLTWTPGSGTTNGYAIYRTAAGGATGTEAYLTTQLTGTTYNDSCTIVLQPTRVPVAVYGNGFNFQW